MAKGQNLFTSVPLSHFPSGLCSSQTLTPPPTCGRDWLAAHQTHFPFSLSTQLISQLCFAIRWSHMPEFGPMECGQKWCIPLPGLAHKNLLYDPLSPPTPPASVILLATCCRSRQLWMSSVKMKDGSLGCWTIHPHHTLTHLWQDFTWVRSKLLLW